ncbi:hypothetical protein B0O99DRAFT_591754 [Bisporella sp. PMI_857]|nr:hypothetical protein B0O99DRAFT_591754 [Bisporella sp. PMI_857]
MCAADSAVVGLPASPLPCCRVVKPSRLVPSPNHYYERRSSASLVVWQRLRPSARAMLHLFVISRLASAGRVACGTPGGFQRRRRWETHEDERKLEGGPGGGKGYSRSDTSNSAGPRVVVKPRRHTFGGELRQACWKLGAKGDEKAVGNSDGFILEAEFAIPYLGRWQQDSQAGRGL